MNRQGPMRPPAAHGGERSETYEDTRSIYRITAQQLRRAEARKLKAEQAWKQLGSIAVSDSMLDEAATKAKHSRSVARVMDWRLTGIELRILLATGKGQAIAWAAAIGLPALLAIFCYLLAGKPMLSLLVAFIPAILCITSLVIALATVVPGREALPRFREQARAGLERLAVLRQEADDAQARHKRLVLAREWYEEYEASNQEYQRLLRVVSSERYQLLHTDWRSLRGTRFEDFVQRVFEYLGYRVETTKTTGDQGLDLIVTGAGRRLGVQCKGYANSVGNHSVQEAYAGMTFYHCTDCMVITNSTFTRGAIDLAARVGCKLVDQSRIIALIEGPIVPPLSRGVPSRAAPPPAD